MGTAAAECESSEQRDSVHEIIVSLE